MNKQNIRPAIQSDLPALREIINSSALFPGEMLDDMIAPFFGKNDNGSIWLTCGPKEQPNGIAFCAPEPMTEGTWNLYLVAIHKSVQGSGLGSAIMRYVENLLADQGVRVLLVETSGLPDFELTRKFYDGLKYTREAKIRDFYAAGDDKIIFHKYL